MEPAAYSHGYERLRRHAVRPDTDHDRRGLGVVVRRGVDIAGAVYGHGRDGPCG